MGKFEDGLDRKSRKAVYPMIKLLDILLPKVLFNSARIEFPLLLISYVLLEKYKNVFDSGKPLG
jgi:hypothetical protein